MGIAPPTPEEFDVAMPPSAKVNSPQEGVIVLEAIPVVDEYSGDTIDPDAPVLEPGVEVVTDGAIDEPSEPSQKKRRSKKDSQPIDS